MSEDHRDGDDALTTSFRSAWRCSQALAPAVLRRGMVAARRPGACVQDRHRRSRDSRCGWTPRFATTLGLRIEKIDPALGNSPNYDETDYRFGRGKVMMNRLDLLSEFDVAYRAIASAPA